MKTKVVLTCAALLLKGDSAGIIQMEYDFSCETDFYADKCNSLLRGVMNDRMQPETTM